jgi:hypothetical protein
MHDVRFLFEFDASEAALLTHLPKFPEQILLGMFLHRTRMAELQNRPIVAN